MSNSILVLGESGTGKSTSIKTLDPKETFVLNIIDKPFPFRGYKKNYIKMIPDGSNGNYFATPNHETILKIINLINVQRLEIKNLIIDDFQYVLCSEYMRRATEVGYTKFTELAQHAWQIVTALTTCRNDLNCFVLTHSETDQNGKAKIKTIGKLLDEKVTLEGIFTVVLHSLIIDGKYRFLTQHDGLHLAKSPAEMFSEKYIDNDLSFVLKQINTYYDDDIQL